MKTLRSLLRGSGSFDEAWCLLEKAALARAVAMGEAEVRLSDPVFIENTARAPDMLCDGDMLVTPRSFPVPDSESVPTPEACELMAGNNFWDQCWEDFLTCRETLVGDVCYWDWETAAFMEHWRSLGIEGL